MTSDPRFLQGLKYPAVIKMSNVEVRRQHERACQLVSGDVADIWGPKVMDVSRSRCCSLFSVQAELNSVRAPQS